MNLTHARSVKVSRDLLEWREKLIPLVSSLTTIVKKREIARARNGTDPCVAWFRLINKISQLHGRKHISTMPVVWKQKAEEERLETGIYSCTRFTSRKRADNTKNRPLVVSIKAMAST